MKIRNQHMLGFLCVLAIIIASSFTDTKKQNNRVGRPKIQAAILLDVSGSMDGLIEQAKAQLWNMVNTMGRAKCSDNMAPYIEIALYEYGRSSNDVGKGYVKQLVSFTDNLDSLSKVLFSLRTNGGDEYCGQVIFDALKELKWAEGNDNYKVIFIAGNEDFLQGSLHYTKACAEAKTKGVVVNTIYCGNREAGIREHWNLNDECGSGSFTNINQNAKEEEIPTPYDSLLFVMNGNLNSTYIGYGSSALTGSVAMIQVDELNKKASASQQLKRIKTKANKAVYKQATWDLVDAKEANGDGVFDKLDSAQYRNTLPDSLRTKSKEELKLFVGRKAEERGMVNRQIDSLSRLREAFITNYRKNQALQTKEATLETEVEKIIRAQARLHNMIIE